MKIQQHKSKPTDRKKLTFLIRNIKFHTYLHEIIGSSIRITKNKKPSLSQLYFFLCQKGNDENELLKKLIYFKVKIQTDKHELFELLMVKIINTSILHHLLHIDKCS